MYNTAEANSDRFHILVVDDEEDIREMICEEIEFEGYECSSAGNGAEALDLLDKKDVDVVITDIRMPGMSGIELTLKISELHDADIIVMTGFAGNLTYEQVIEIGASDFVKKPVGPKELIIRLKRVLRERNLLNQRRKAEEDLKISFNKLGRALEQTVNALTTTVEMRDPYTSGHQLRVTHLACAIGNQMQLPEDRISGLRIAGLLHDIGKISVPAEILSKPGILTAAERNLFKDHPIVGYEILKGIEFAWPVAEIVQQHHEKIDGSGYPSGLRGDEIYLEAKIICVSDVVEAMSSHRPYRPTMGLEAALMEIEKNKGILYEPSVADACLILFREKGFFIG